MKLKVEDEVRLALVLLDAEDIRNLATYRRQRRRVEIRVDRTPEPGMACEADGRRSKTTSFVGIEVRHGPPGGSRSRTSVGAGALDFGMYLCEHHLTREGAAAARRRRGEGYSPDPATRSVRRY